MTLVAIKFTVQWLRLEQSETVKNTQLVFMTVKFSLTHNILLLLKRKLSNILVVGFADHESIGSRTHQDR